MDFSEESLETIAANAPITALRRLNPKLDDQMPKPYLARALVAVDPASKYGSRDHQHNNMTVLQQHVSFFDRNKDGIIYPWETYQGFRAIGFGVFISILAAFLINVNLSYVTSSGWIPSPLFPIYIANIHKAKHGSDSEVYDTEGRFDPAKFDSIFSKYALTYTDKLTYSELQSMLKGNRNMNDLFGWLAAHGEWSFLYKLAKNKEGFIEKEALRGMYDGSLFEYFEKQNASRKAR
ncbi:hypothetical protein SUGI_0221740 [Cryptomeria japonica]|uniref:peroxygenase n=1 Tax=Cryptomeria japonica TaxID=3369 RepID=UPI002408D3A8|nr:peroxygenase [Cryptomeria japonica]GLJ13878.1 hypothetical protein SUGI_0221740 [Cryptomeria japonica]